MTSSLVYLCDQPRTMEPYAAPPSNDIAVLLTRAGTRHHNNTF